jgi:hypothetical protein
VVVKWWLLVAWPRAHGRVHGDLHGDDDPDDGLHAGQAVVQLDALVPAGDDARRTLDERLARGDIDIGEYERLRTVIEDAGGRTGDRQDLEVR